LVLSYLAKAKGFGASDMLLIDLSGNDYSLLRDSLLLSLSQTMASLLSKKRIGRACVLVPKMPPPGSLFWVPLQSSKGGVISVISAAGEATCVPATHVVSKATLKRSVQFQRQLNRSSKSALEAKLVRRVGHFLRPDGKACSEFYFDGSSCVTEISALFSDRLRALRKSSPPIEYILACAEHSPWLVEAAVKLADEQRVKFIDFHKSPSAEKTKAKGRQCLILTDLVDTGNSVSNAIAQVTRGKLVVQPTILAALSTARIRSVKVGPQTYTVESLQVVDLRQYERSTCPQCRLDTPHSRVQGDPFYGVAARDMWHMMLAYNWRAEHDPPVGQQELPITPDFERVFEDYGDWLAFKIDERLRSLGFRSEVVVVCPDELAATVLLDSLRIRLQERLIAVTLPSKLPEDVIRLSRERPGALRGELDRLSTDMPVWLRQLHNIAKNHSSVFILDEFNASGGTARAIYRILQHLDIPVHGYIPVLDRAPASLMGWDVRSYALYQLNSPRQR